MSNLPKPLQRILNNAKKDDYLFGNQTKIILIAVKGPLNCETAVQYLMKGCSEQKRRRTASFSVYRH